VVGVDEQAEDVNLLWAVVAGQFDSWDDAYAEFAAGLARVGQGGDGVVVGDGDGADAPRGAFFDDLARGQGAVGGVGVDVEVGGQGVLLSASLRGRARVRPGVGRRVMYRGCKVGKTGKWEKGKRSR